MGQGSGEITLRPATLEDLPAIEALLASYRLPSVELDRWIEHVVVAKSDGRLVGCGGLEVYPEDACGLVRSMAAEERLGGLGTRILEWAFGHAHELGLTRLFLFTVGAREFYLRFGFEDATLDDFPPSARASFQYRFVAEHGDEWDIKAMARDLEA